MILLYKNKDITFVNIYCVTYTLHNCHILSLNMQQIVDIGYNAKILHYFHINARLNEIIQF